MNKTILAVGLFFLITCLLDLGTTVYGLSTGFFYEANPLFNIAGYFGFFTLKLILSTSMFLLTVFVNKKLHPGKKIWIGIFLMSFVQLFCGINNVLIIMF